VAWTSPAPVDEVLAGDDYVEEPGVGSGHFREFREIGLHRGDSRAPNDRQRRAVAVQRIGRKRNLFRFRGRTRLGEKKLAQNDVAGTFDSINKCAVGVRLALDLRKTGNISGVALWRRYRGLVGFTRVASHCQRASIMAREKDVEGDHFRARRPERVQHLGVPRADQRPRPEFVQRLLTERRKRGPFSLRRSLTQSGCW